MSGSRKIFLISAILCSLALGTAGGAHADSTAGERQGNDLEWEASTYMKTKDYVNAERCLRRAVSLNARSVWAFSSLGFVCDKQGKFRDAVEAFQRAVELDPNATDDRVRLAGVYLSMRDDASAMHTLDSLQRMQLSAEDKIYVLDHLAYLHSRNRKPKEAAEEYRQLTLLKPDDPDYLSGLVRAYYMAGRYSEASLKASVFVAKFPTHKETPYIKTLVSKLRREVEPAQWFGRWSERSMPLKVCLLDPARPVLGYKPNYRAMVGRAISTWQGLSRKLVSFQFVSSPAQANIVIDWTDDTTKLKEMEDEKDSHTIGLTHIDSTDERGNFKTAKISLLCVDAFDDKKPLPDLMVESIALHEFGHVLGLPHSSNPNDVMFPWERNKGSGRTQLSSADVGRLIQLYSYRRTATAQTGTVSGASGTRKSAGR